MTLEKLPLYEPMPVAEEVLLINRAQAGDPVARETILLRNQRFVISESLKFQKVSVYELEDLVNEGNIGLMKALDRFDTTKGFKFISYAVWWIRASILSAIEQSGHTIRLPGNQIGLLRKITKVAEKLRGELEREPTSTEIGKILGISAAEVSLLRSVDGRAGSLDLEDSGGDPFLYEMFEGENNLYLNHIEEEGLSDQIRRYSSNLSDRERLVVFEYHGINSERQQKTLEQIAEILGLTRESVRQIKVKALTKMQRRAGLKPLKIKHQKRGRPQCRV